MGVDKEVATWFDVSADNFANDFLEGVEESLLLFGIKGEKIVPVTIGGRDDDREDGSG